MCDMYGHAWFEPEHNLVIQDYMRCNSHRELAVENGLADIEIIAPGGQKTIEKLPCVRCGIDPIDGNVTKPVRGHNIWNAFYGQPVAEPEDELELDKLQRMLVRATWDKTCPTVEKLSSWIEAHFARREDYQNWAERGPLLINEMYREGLLEQAQPEVEVHEHGMLYVPKPNYGRRTAMEEQICPIEQPKLTAGRLIDRFQLHPNNFWTRAATTNRYDNACYVLEAAGLN